MKHYPLIQVCWYAVDIVLVFAFVVVLYSAIWEFSTRNYLKGFSDAIIPSSDKPEQKVEAILAWMAHGPARRDTGDAIGLQLRDPESTLNIQRLLEVCGTATNAFVNLAQSSDLRARRLLLLNENLVSKHVVVEVYIDDRWAVVDPSYHVVLRLPGGRLVSRLELQNPTIFHAVAQHIPGYPQDYTYERTVHVRVSRIPLIGSKVRGMLNFAWPNWEESINWTLLVERESFAMLVGSTLLLFLAMAARLLLGWFCSHRLGIARIRWREQVMLAGRALLRIST